jgi:transketolase
MHTVKPLDEALLADAFDRFRAVAVVEEHSVIGGLGSAVAEWLARRDGPHPPLVACGTPDAFISEAGSQQWMRERCGLTGPAVAAKILARLEVAT